MKMYKEMQRVERKKRIKKNKATGREREYKKKHSLEKGNLRTKNYSQFEVVHGEKKEKEGAN